MITSKDLEGASCASEDVDPRLFDPDTHNHLRLGGSNACWLCEEAREICEGCPVVEACFQQARESRESFTIRAGFAWSNGRPRLLNRRRR